MDIVAYFVLKIKWAGRKGKMTLTQKRVLILLIIIIVAAILGRFAIRAFINFLVGGTMSGGNFL